MPCLNRIAKGCLAVTLISIAVAYLAVKSTAAQPVATDQRLATQLSQAFAQDWDRARIVFPPPKKVLLGALVSLDANGEPIVLDYLPAGSFEPHVQRKTGKTMSDEMLVQPNAALLERLVSLKDRPRLPVDLKFEATDVVFVTATHKDHGAIEKKLRHFDQFVPWSFPFQPTQSKKKVYLVSSVYRGIVRSTVAWQDSCADDATSRLAYFHLTRPRHGKGTLVFQSDGPIDFACHLDLLDFDPTGPSKGNNQVLFDARDRANEQLDKLRREGRHRDAAAVALRALEIEQHIHGQIHADVATALSRLAELYEWQEDWDRALVRRHEVVTLAEKLYGQKHWRTADARLLLEYSETLRRLDIDKRLALRASDDLETQAARLGDEGNIPEAVFRLKQVIAVRRTLLGSEHWRLSAPMSKLGMVSWLRGDFRAARKLNQEILAIQRKTLPKDHADLAQTLYNLGVLQEGLLNYQAARRSYEEALAIRRTALDDYHPEIGETLLSLGDAQRACGDRFEARKSYQEALAIFGKVVNQGHSFITESLIRLGSVQVQLGDFAGAAGTFTKLRAIQSEAKRLVGGNGEGPDDKYKREREQAIVAYERWRAAQITPALTSQTSKETPPTSWDKAHVAHVAFSADGKWIVSEGTDNTVRLWGSATERGYDKVTVFYATDRHATSPATLETTTRRPFWPHFLDFFMLNRKWIGWLSLGAISLVLIWRRRKTTLRVLNATAAGLLVLWVAVALIYADQRAGMRGAFADAGLAADRPGDADRSDHYEMNYGTCDISIPPNHVRGSGKLEERTSVLLVNIERENPSKHVTYVGRTPLEWGDFIKRVRLGLDQSKERECFVFIHGYNNTFEEAAKRTAQFWYDLTDFDGLPILYSWQSQGAASEYLVDDGEATWTQPHFLAFLRAFLSESSAKHIHLIAHSMGTRILAGAMAELGKHGELDSATCTIREIILAAPDIDANVFKRDLAPQFVKKKPKVTLYASANDEALIASRSVHKYPRAGDTKDGRVIVDGIDTVEASLLDTSFDTHSYFAACRSVIGDIRDVFAGLPPAKRRGLREQFEGKQRFWMFTK
jgi:esterase/lipase superfamily enzyme/tetratricopeptide (TPR) repeat protein